MKTVTPSKSRNGHSAPDLASQLRADAERRRKLCVDEVQAVLLKHNCTIRIHPVVQIEGKPIEVVLVPLPPA